MINIYKLIRVKILEINKKRTIIALKELKGAIEGNANNEIDKIEKLTSIKKKEIKDGTIEIVSYVVVLFKIICILCNSFLENNPSSMVHYSFPVFGPLIGFGLIIKFFCKYFAVPGCG